MEWINEAWLRAHPLPVHGEGTDKNSRGRVVLVGGAEFVPGALRLTGEAVLRAGAGKLQMATVAHVATALGVLVPEAAMIALPTEQNGEIAADAAEVLEDAVSRCDTLIVGPGMSAIAATARLLNRLLAHPRSTLSVLLDAAAITSARTLQAIVRAHGGRIVMTPHHGEMASLCGLEVDQITASPENAAAMVAEEFKVVIVLKAAQTIIAAPDGTLLRYNSDCIGLATGGSGDVLAGIIGGLMARGAPAMEAAAWGVFVHGGAGLALAKHHAPIGFLAREMLPEIPRLMAKISYAKLAVR